MVSPREGDNEFSCMLVSAHNLKNKEEALDFMAGLQRNVNLRLKVDVQGSYRNRNMKFKTF